MLVKHLELNLWAASTSLSEALGVKKFVIISPPPFAIVRCAAPMAYARADIPYRGMPSASSHLWPSHSKRPSKSVIAETEYTRPLRIDNSATVPQSRNPKNGCRRVGTTSLAARRD